MYGVDHAAMVSAFHAHKDGETKFTRRMAINMADHFGIKPMQVVWYLEKNKLLKRGSYDWFQYNGGITKAHVQEVRADRFRPEGTATSQQSASPSPPQAAQSSARISAPPIPTSPDTNNQEK